MTAMDAPTEEPTEAPVRRLSRDAAIGVALLVLCAVFVTWASLVGPRPATWTDGSPEPYVFTNNQPQQRHQMWLPMPVGDSVTPAQNGGVVVWSSGGHVWWDRSDQSQASPDQQGLPPVSTATQRPYEAVLPLQRVDRAALVLWMIGVGFIVFGKRPRTGSRWYWFWLSLLPLGLGVAWYAIRERWRPPTDSRRWPGGVGVAHLLLLTMAVQMAAWLLSGL